MLKDHKKNINDFYPQKKTGFWHPINTYNTRINHIKRRINQEQQYYAQGGSAENDALKKLVSRVTVAVVVLGGISYLINYWFK